jgi:uncharacterized membrane protein
MKKLILASMANLLYVTSFAQTDSTSNMMNHDMVNNNYWRMNWGMGYGLGIVAIILAVTIVIFLIYRRRKDTK